MLRLLARASFVAALVVVAFAACDDDPVRDDGSVDRTKDAGRDSARPPSVEPEECGGCSNPPKCNADGTAPSTKCSCGCPVGKLEQGGICTAAGCVGPIPDGGLDAGDGGDGG